MFDVAEIFTWFIENAGYMWVFVLMVIESSFVPFPSEIIVPPAAYLAVTTGRMDILLIILVATGGAIVGALINYYLSLWIGRPLVYKFAESRLGHIFLLNQAKVEHAETYFARHGAVSTFIGRLIPAVRQLISIPAGLSRMNVGIFVIFTGLGAGVWNCVLAALGYWLGKTVSLAELFQTLEKYNGYLNYAGLGIGILCLAFITYKIIRHHRRKKLN